MFLEERLQVTSKLRARKSQIAESITELFFRVHPDWNERFGARGRLRGVEDAGYHVDYLLSAMEANSPSVFAHYLCWTNDVLSKRSISPEFLIENVCEMGKEISNNEPPKVADWIQQIIQSGVHILQNDACESVLNQTAIRPFQGASEFFSAVLSGDRCAAMRVVEDVLARTQSPIAIYEHLFQATLVEVGRMWQHNQLTVAQEHRATAIVQYVLAEMYAQVPFPAPVRGKALITGVQGELHQVGAQLVADTLEADGWHVVFLGTNLPTEAIMQTICEEKPKFVGISVTMPFNLSNALTLIEQVQQLPDAPQVVVGGSAFRFAQQLVQELRIAGTGTDLQSAISLTRNLAA